MDGILQGMGRRMAWWSKSPGPSSAAWRGRHWIEKAVAGIDGLLIAVDHRGRVMFLNGPAEKVTGWPLKEAHGRPLGEVFPLVEEPSGKPAEILLPGAAEPDGTDWVRRRALRTREGRSCPIEYRVAPIPGAAGQAEGFVLLAHDVNERRRVIEAMARMAAIVETSDDAIIGVALDGSITTWNAGAHRLHGYSADEVLGRSLSLISPEPSNQAGEAVRRREAGLPLLSTTIIGVTLASGQFLAAALMAWSFRFWDRRHRDRIHSTRRALLPAMAQHRRFARLWTDRAESEVTLDQLKPGDLIVIAAGEAVPADGRIVRGSALIDERPIRGGDGSTLKREGDRAFAGTRLGSGELRVEVEAIGGSTRAAALARAIHSGTGHDPSPFAVTVEGEAFARRAVLPTLATAGLGLLALDLTAAAAVLRPDYATGPGLGVSLETLLDSSLRAREGILIRDPSAIRRLAEADLLFFDDHPDLGRRELVVAAIEADPDESLVLQLAEAALRGLDDERARALREAREARSPIPIEAKPESDANAITLRHQSRIATIADDAGSPDSGLEGASPIVISADGRTIGRIAFARGDSPRAARAIRAIRGSDPWAVGLMSVRPDSEAFALADSLGIEHFWSGLGSEAKLDLLRTLRERGIRVACVGDCEREPAVAREAHVAISLNRVGVVLVTLGAVGLVVPGPIPPGTPFLVVGAVFLCPKLVKPLGGRIRKRFPTVYNAFDDQVMRFRSDLERRYPGSIKAG